LPSKLYVATLKNLLFQSTHVFVFYATMYTTTGGFRKWLAT
jgi:hypothetical protein